MAQERETAADILASAVERQEPTEEFIETEDGVRVTYFGEKVKTRDDVVEASGLDMDIWELVEFTRKSWTTPMKVNRDGNDYPTQIANWHVQAKFKRRAPRFVQDGLKSLLDSWPADARIRSQEPSGGVSEHVMSMGLHDAHFGKLCWGEETGQDYDTDIAAQVYADAVVELLEKSKPFNVGTVYLPVGSDFFQVDNWKNTTHRGTEVDHDGRFQRVFKVGVKAIAEAVDACLDYCRDVTLLWVPGNHDTTTSWYLMQTVAERFRGNDRVTWDDSPKARKCILYGVNMLWVLHGDKERMESLPLIMATELRKEWAAHPCCEIHTGHKHKAKEVRYVQTDEFGGIRVRTLPSISGTDKWHYEKGFVKNRQVAEAYLYHESTGYSGHLSTGYAD